MKNHQTSNTPPADKCARRLNKRGSILISAVLAAILLTMVSVGYFATLTSSFGAVKSSGDALEAQKVAEIESNKIKLTDYENLDSKVQQGKWVDAPDNPGWQYFVTLGNEKVIDGDNKQRIAEVKVRRKGDEESRFSTVVPVSSEGAGGNNGKGFKKVKFSTCNNYNHYRYPVCTDKNMESPYHKLTYKPRIYNRPEMDCMIMKKNGFLFKSLFVHTTIGEHHNTTTFHLLTINGDSLPTGTFLIPVNKGDEVCPYYPVDQDWGNNIGHHSLHAMQPFVFYVLN